MKYPKGLSLVELVQHYVNYRSEEVLNELARRDKLNQIERFEEPDNQTVFDFHKEVASAQEVANNESVVSFNNPNVTWRYNVLAEKIDASNIEVCCANCNILHEYERGNRTERQDLWDALMLKLKDVQ